MRPNAVWLQLGNEKKFCLGAHKIHSSLSNWTSQGHQFQKMSTETEAFYSSDRCFKWAEVVLTQGWTAEKVLSSIAADIIFPSIEITWTFLTNKVAVRNYYVTMSGLLEAIVNLVCLNPFTATYKIKDGLTENLLFWKRQHPALEESSGTETQPKKRNDELELLTQIAESLARVGFQPHTVQLFNFFINLHRRGDFTTAFTSEFLKTFHPRVCGALSKVFVAGSKVGEFALVPPNSYIDASLYPDLPERLTAIVPPSRYEMTTRSGVQQIIGICRHGLLMRRSTDQSRNTPFEKCHLSCVHGADCGLINQL
jgi:hypothetical protein